MNYYRYINQTYQNQDSSRRAAWFKPGAVCPYNLWHRQSRPQLEFVQESLFRRYCSNHPRPFRRNEKHPPSRGGSDLRHNKLYKFYWRLHEK